MPSSVRPAREPRGMALIAVLWIVAALSLIATGLANSVRAEARATALARQEVQAEALGDAAIQLALQSLKATPERLVRTRTGEISYRGVAMRVELMPVNGLINLNRAGAPLLSRMFAVAGGMPQDAADALAQSIVQWREQRDIRGAQQRFEAEEDLLRFPGVGYDLYARLDGLLIADLRGSGRVNPLAAPAPVLAVLAGGNLGAAQQIAAAREADQPGVDTSALDGAMIENSSPPRLRARAWVPLDGGAQLLVTRSVSLTARSPDGAPWQTFRTTTSLVPADRSPS